MLSYAIRYNFIIIIQIWFYVLIFVSMPFLGILIYSHYKRTGARLLTDDVKNSIVASSTLVLMINIGFCLIVQIDDGLWGIYLAMFPFFTIPFSVLALGLSWYVSKRIREKRSVRVSTIRNINSGSATDTPKSSDK